MRRHRSSWPRGGDCSPPPTRSAAASRPACARVHGNGWTISATASGTPTSEGNERLERARLQLTRTLADLQELAHGLHPRELVQAGLPGALASLAERAPVPVDLQVRVGRLTAELEATIYYVCAEALANVAKYASATSARIEVTADDGRARVVVADDGVGGADRARGTGLQGLADRVEAVGGVLEITSPPGSGTRLAAEIPLGGEAH